MTVKGPHRRGQTGIRAHRVRRLDDDEDRDRVRGIPVTSVHRALHDYAEVVGIQWLRLALEAAERRDLLDTNKLQALLDRSPGATG